MSPQAATAGASLGPRRASAVVRAQFRSETRSYRDRPIRIIVANAAGGAMDNVMRMIARIAFE